MPATRAIKEKRQPVPYRPTERLYDPEVEGKKSLARGNVRWVAETRLCVGCGTCSAVCPIHVIEMAVEPTDGIVVPRVLDECTDCGLCEEACPGHEVNFEELNLLSFHSEKGQFATDEKWEAEVGNAPDHWTGQTSSPDAQAVDAMVGRYLRTYLSVAVDTEHRRRAPSGGIITTLTAFAIEKGLVDGALVSGHRPDDPFTPVPYIARTPEEVYASVGSHYSPVASMAALDEIIRDRKGRYIVVGLPCHLHGVRKAQLRMKKLQGRLLTIGLFCGAQRTLGGVDYLLDQMGVRKEDVVAIDHRGGGWPGRMRVELRDGTHRDLEQQSYSDNPIYVSNTPTRCLTCSDGLAELADIACGDAWLPEVLAKDTIGTSIILTRSEAGDELLRAACDAGLITLDSTTRDKVIESQENLVRYKRAQLWAKFRLFRYFGLRIPDYDMPFNRSGLRESLEASQFVIRVMIAKGRLPRWLTRLFPVAKLIWRQVRRVLTRGSRRTATTS